MRIAVVIPCFNVSAHVGAAVESVLAQTHRDVDLIAIDDASSDDTRDVLQDLARKHPGTFRWEPAKGRGAGAARNQGLHATTGEYVQFLDADDVLHPGKIAGQVELVQRSGDAAVVAGAYRNKYPDGSHRDVLPLAGDPWLALIGTRAGTTSANLWRRTAVEAAGGWREDLGSSQDYELLFRILKAGGTMLADPVVATDILKRSSGSISRTAERENWLRYLDLRYAIRDHLAAEDREAHARAIAAADQYLFMALRVLSRHDRSAAFEAFDHMIPKGFVPEVNAATSKAYVRLFKWFGFRAAERAAGCLSAGAGHPEDR